MATIVCNNCGKEFGSVDELKPIVEDNDHNDTVLEEKCACPDCGYVEDFSVIEQHNPRWDDDSIQFPRLLAEIASTVELTEDQMGELAASMDLEFNDIAEIFDRAQARWEEIKESFHTLVDLHN